MGTGCQYGGSMENRTRYLRNILERARKKVSANFAIGIRISSSEHVPGGLTPEDTAEICKYIEPLVDFYDLSIGIHHETHAIFIPDADGTVIDEAAVIKKKVKASAPATAQTRKARAVKEQRQKLKRSGKVEDAAKALLSLTS